MKIKANISKGQLKSISITLQNSYDMDKIYDVIKVGDIVRAEARLKHAAIVSSTSSIASTEVSYTCLTIHVDIIKFNSKRTHLKLKGCTIEPNCRVPLGTFCTLKLGIGDLFELWNGMSVVGLLNDENSSDYVVAVVIEEGEATISLVKSKTLLFCYKVESKTPSINENQGYKDDEKENGEENEAEYEELYELIVGKLLENIDLDDVKCILIGSPNSMNEEFLDYMWQQACTFQIQNILDNVDKFLLVYSSSGKQKAINEILCEPYVALKLSNAISTSETEAKEKLDSVANLEPTKVCLDKECVAEAAKSGNVDSLLISDQLFRSPDTDTRWQYFNLIELVKNCGGKTYIIDSRIVEEDFFAQSGVAAILISGNTDENLDFSFTYYEEDSEDHFHNYNTFQSANSTQSNCPQIPINSDQNCKCFSSIFGGEPFASGVAINYFHTNSGAAGYVDVDDKEVQCNLYSQ